MCNNSSKSEEQKEHEKTLLEVYKLHAGFSNSLTYTRAYTNYMYMFINGAMLTAVSHFDKVFTGVILSIFGIVLCFVWKNTIFSFKILNSAKIKNLMELESELNFDFYDKEWKVCEQKGYGELTNYEAYLPKIFICLYVTVCLYLLI